MWEFLHGDRWTMPTMGEAPGLEIEIPLHRMPKYQVLTPQIVALAAETQRATPQRSITARIRSASSCRSARWASVAG